MIRRPPRSTQSRSSAASDVYKRQVYKWFGPHLGALYAKAAVLDRLPAYKVRPAHDRYETVTPSFEAFAGTLAASWWRRCARSPATSARSAAGCLTASLRSRACTSGESRIGPGPTSGRPPSPSHSTGSRRRTPRRNSAARASSPGTATSTRAGSSSGWAPTSTEASSGLALFTTPVSYTHLRAHETRHDLVCRL